MDDSDMFRNLKIAYIPLNLIGIEMEATRDSSKRRIEPVDYNSHVLRAAGWGLDTPFEREENYIPLMIEDVGKL